MDGIPTAAGPATADRDKRSDQIFWERYFAFYDTLNQAIPYREMIEHHAGMLAPESDDLILDAGTGSGNVAMELLARGANVVGVDFCEPALERCRRKAPSGTFAFADLTRSLDFEEGHFDKIACCCVFHVLDRPGQQSAVREFFRVLKPGGRLAVTAFTTGFSAVKVYVETLRRHRTRATLPGTAAFALRHSFNTARILYYVSRIQKGQRTGNHNFLSAADLTALLERAGFCTLPAETVFANQCVATLAVKPAATAP